MNFFKKKRIYISILGIIYIFCTGCAINNKSVKPISQSRIQFINLFQNEFIEENVELDLMRQVRLPLPNNMKTQLEATNYLLAITKYKFANNLSDTDFGLLPLNPFWTNEGVISIKKAMMFTLMKNQFLVIDHENKLITIFHSNDLTNIALKEEEINSIETLVVEKVKPINPSNKNVDGIEPIEADQVIKTEIQNEVIPEQKAAPVPYVVEEGSSLSLVINKWASRDSLTPKFNLNNTWVKNIVFTSNKDHGLNLSEAMNSIVETLNNYPSLIERNIRFKYILNKNSLEIHDE